MFFIEILFRCDDYWVVDKPAGMSFHAESETLGVMQALSISYPNYTFFPVHRLDKITSGVLIVACHAKAASLFGKMFEQHEIEKCYLALSERKPKKKQGTVFGGMVPSRRGQWKLTQEHENFAATQFFSASFEEKRIFIVKPLTGKTHQIRVALKSLGAPILGDVRYGGTVSDRGYLHAYSIQFEWGGEMKKYLCPPTSGEHFSSELFDFVVAHFDESLLKWPSKKVINITQHPLDRTEKET